MLLSRRLWLASTAAAVLPAIEPIKRTGKAQLRLGLAAYSFRKALDLKKKPREMTLDDFADLAAALKVEAIEPTAYYFADTSDAYLARLWARCDRLGLAISGTAVGNDFCHPEKDKLDAQIKMVKEWAERCARMGGKTVRIFAGTLKKNDTEARAVARCVAAIEEACQHAAKQGVVLALENHGGITATLPQMLALVKAVKHDAFGVNLDTGNFHTEDPYADLAALAPYAVTVQVKTEIRRAGKQKEQADLGRLIGLLRQANYSGYVILEHEADEDPKTAVPQHLAALRKLIA